MTREDYKPDDQGKFDYMCSLFVSAQTEKELDQAAMMFLPDLSYSRRDILTARKFRERELKRAE